MTGVVVVPIECVHNFVIYYFLYGLKCFPSDRFMPQQNVYNFVFLSLTLRPMPT